MPQSSANSLQAKVPGNGETILLVEDESFVREVTRQVLEAAGYVVLQATNAEEALWTFCQHEGAVHLLLTDMVMPGKDGPTLAAELEALSPGLKTILTSGYGESLALQEKAGNARVFFLPKPFSTRSLTQKVRHVLDQKEAFESAPPA